MPSRVDSQIVLRKVLVVENEADIQRVIRISLKSRGVTEVAVASDGEECLAIVKQFKPDLILLDVTMPKLDGFETCQLLKANPETRAIPVIFLTARVQNHEEALGADVGGIGYVGKPFDPMTLHDQILAILGKGAAQKS